MQPFRKNLAIAIDGGGIKGVMITKALSMVEEQLGYPLHERTGLTAGTSTGSIIAAGLGSGLEAKALHELYLELGNKIFHKSIRTLLWPLFNYRYSNLPLKQALDQYFGKKMTAELWKAQHPIDMVITTFDIVENRTCFIKPYKSNYENWSVVKAVMASAAAPTYFPSIDGRYVDGGLGSYCNPCYLAAYEIVFALGWKRRRNHADQHRYRTRSEYRQARRSESIFFHFDTLRPSWMHIKFPPRINRWTSFKSFSIN